ncbi:MAG: SDR family oxidoreductase [Burkholderiales bacterium]|nr:SDR family oxidoreductase [Burkholderiales bacterium]
MNAGDVLQGKVALVTGAGSGLGAALCEVLCQAGAMTIAADLRLEAAQSIAGRVRGFGCTCTALGMDVGDERAVSVGMEEAIAQFGGLDIVVNNAGTDVTLPFDEPAVADWQRILATNLTGPFLVSRPVVRSMRARGGGHIVNIASTAAKRAWPNASAYRASKWGLLGLSHALHSELRGQGIKVSAVVAGGMRTPFLLHRFPDIDLACLQEPRNVAQAVLGLLMMPAKSVIPELMVLPMRETSWP